MSFRVNLLLLLALVSSVYFIRYMLLALAPARLRELVCLSGILTYLQMTVSLLATQSAKQNENNAENSVTQQKLKCGSRHGCFAMDPLSV